MKNIENHFIIHNNKIVRYKIEYSLKIKNIHIKLDKNLDILVKANPLISHIIIENFLFNNIDKLNLLIKKKKDSSLYNINEKKISIFGDEHNIFIEKSFKNETYKIYHKKIFLFLNEKENVEKVIRRFLKKTAEAYIIPRTVYLANKLNIKIGKISIKWLMSTWGICHNNSREISFSSKLVIFDKSTIDYVIIHELCHLIEPNHSANFWNNVKQFCPDFKIFRNRLKNF